MLRSPAFLAAFVCVAGFACSAFADVKLPPIFSDNMVLQANVPVAIYGKASPSEAVEVSFADQVKSGAADAKGDFRIMLDALKPTEKGAELKIGSKTIKNVIVGEVWHASGQSNMRYQLTKATGGAEEIAKANLPDFRCYLNGTWQVCTPKTSPQFSAVAFFFVQDLRGKLKEPFGIIDTSVSGAQIQSFVSPDLLSSDKAVADAAGSQKKLQNDTSEFWTKLPEGGDNLANILPYTVKGFLWYQGEGNRDYPNMYAKVFPAMIADWRKHAGAGDVPFLFVQLANWTDKAGPKYADSKDSALREAQLKTLAASPNTAMAVSIDCGVKDVHYPMKKPVGDRLALAARALAYGEKIEYSGPLFESASFDGGKATVTFTHAGTGLTATGGGKLAGFVLAGADKNWVRADATIEGDKVVVSSPAVAKPVYVRYAFEKNPECNLANKEGLPASPFRSDTLENYSTTDGSKD